MNERIRVIVMMLGCLLMVAGAALYGRFPANHLACAFIGIGIVTIAFSQFSIPDKR